MRIDLIFAFSGIEPEIEETAEKGHILSGINVRIASTPSLIAMKTLAADWNRRPQDVLDIQQLLEVATPIEIAETRRLLDLITERGYNRNKDLQKDLDGYIERFKD